MIFASPHRARYAAVPAAVLVAGGIGLGVGGWLTDASAAYVWGVVFAALGLCLLAFIALPMLRRWVRAALCFVLTATVVGLGLWVPGSVLAADFDGENVLWSTPSKKAGNDMHGDESVEAVFDDTVVLANRESSRVVSLVDGRELYTLTAGRDAQFTVADGRLLVLSGSFAMLYGRNGEPVWPLQVFAERAIAADAGVTVLEDRNRVVSAIADDGSPRWSRLIDDWRGYLRRFPIESTLPGEAAYERGSPVLPSIAALPVSDTRWQFVDVAGRSVASAVGKYGGVVGDTPVTSTQVGDQCDVSFGGDRREVGCTSGKPWAQGDVLFFQDGADAWAVTAGKDTKLEDAALGPEDRDRRLAVSGEGMAWHDGRLIRGYPGLSNGKEWRFVAESEHATPTVGNGAVAVVTALHGTNPLSPPYQRVTVHDGRTGKMTGSIRAHEVDSVYPVGRGRALLVADGKVMLIGAGN